MANDGNLCGKIFRDAISRFTKSLRRVFLAFPFKRKVGLGSRGVWGGGGGGGAKRERERGGGRRGEETRTDRLKVIKKDRQTNKPKSRQRDN